ncbi:MAG: SUMF1/EgtB/PvdO family nonheme iron enzyme [Anaerolineales bacterium]|nr:SUMF1/EgtB/PvdO family nonheme iron enzyme [Anaerolineales bacterium]
MIPTEVPITATPVSTQTPQPAATSETVKISSMDGMTQIFIPTGTVYMGGLDVLRDSDEIPAHEVMIDAYWIDQVEVTNGMYNLCVRRAIADRQSKTARTIASIILAILNFEITQLCTSAGWMQIYIVNGRSGISPPKRNGNGPRAAMICGHIRGAMSPQMQI